MAFRMAMHPKFRTTAVILMVGGWCLALAAAGDSQLPSDETGQHVRFLMTVFGGALAFMGMFAGVSRWVAEPAARKVMAEHIKERERAHEAYVPRIEWDEKHEELKRSIFNLSEKIVALTSSLSAEKATTARHRRDA